MASECLRRGNLLAIDTSSSFAYCAACSANGVVVERRSEGMVSHNEELGALTSAVLSMAGIEPATLSGIVIGNGPGSFTGLRIGYTFIKGLSLGLRLPVAQLSSMKATAQAALEHHGLEYHGVSAVLADARRDECFVSAYQRSPNGQLLELLAPQILARAQIEGVVKRLSAGQGIRWIFEPELGWGVPGVPPAGVARGLLEILEDEDIHEFSVDTLSAIHPQYLRAVAAKTILERSK